jgi:hypothetical protein
MREEISKDLVIFALDGVYRIYKKRGVTAKDADKIWVGLALACAYQLRTGGRFADVIEAHPECFEAILSN